MLLTALTICQMRVPLSIATSDEDSANGKAFVYVGVPLRNQCGCLRCKRRKTGPSCWDFVGAKMTRTQIVRDEQR
jgi:hypothetical protein